MIEIKKGTEPKELLEYRKQEFASYADMKGDVKEKVMKSLLSEQGHLCAYCMSRIDEGDGKHRATIEHCIQQAVTDEKERLNYKNMVAVCWGNRDAHSNEDKSCDAKRGSLKVDKQDMKKINVFDGRTLTDIKYASDGTIYSDDEDVNEDLNLRLNLNCEARRLKECRRQALSALHRDIAGKYPNKTAPKSYYQKLMDHYTEQREMKEPYSGILIYWLEKHI